MIGSASITASIMGVGSMSGRCLLKRVVAVGHGAGLRGRDESVGFFYTRIAGRSK